MKFKAILIGALVKPFGDKKNGTPIPWQRLCSTQAECEHLGRGVLDSLEPDERKTASVRIVEIREVVVGELR